MQGRPSLHGHDWPWFYRGQEHMKTEWAEDRTVALFQYHRLVNAAYRCFAAIALLISSFSAEAEALPDPVAAGWQGA